MEGNESEGERTFGDVLVPPPPLSLEHTDALLAVSQRRTWGVSQHYHFQSPGFVISIGGPVYLHTLGILAQDRHL